MEGNFHSVPITLLLSSFFQQAIWRTTCAWGIGACPHQNDMSQKEIGKMRRVLRRSRGSGCFHAVSAKADDMKVLHCDHRRRGGSGSVRHPAIRRAATQLSNTGTTSLPTGSKKDLVPASGTASLDVLVPGNSPPHAGFPGLRHRRPAPEGARRERRKPHRTSKRSRPLRGR